MVDIAHVHFIGALAAATSAAAFLRWMDVVVGGVAATIAWSLFGIAATNAERVTDSGVVVDVSSDMMALLGFAFAGVMLLFTIKPLFISVDPRRADDPEVAGR